jgi:hypothetical protein
MKISKHNAEHYIWGDNCDGWRLVKIPDLSVIHERMPPHRSNHCRLSIHQSHLDSERGTLPKERPSTFTFQMTPSSSVTSIIPAKRTSFALMSASTYVHSCISYS